MLTPAAEHYQDFIAGRIDAVQYRRLLAEDRRDEAEAAGEDEMERARR